MLGHKINVSQYFKKPNLGINLKAFERKDDKTDAQSRSDSAESFSLPHFFYSKLGWAPDDEVCKNCFEIISSTDVNAER